MIFRKRGNNVQIIRTVTDAKTGKKAPTALGSVNLRTRVFAPELQAALTKAEVAEVEQWLAAEDRIGELQAEIAVRTLADQINLANAAIGKLDPAEAQPLVQEITAAWGRFRRAVVAKELV